MKTEYCALNISAVSNLCNHETLLMAINSNCGLCKPQPEWAYLEQCARFNFCDTANCTRRSLRRKAFADGSKVTTGWPMKGNIIIMGFKTAVITGTWQTHSAQLISGPIHAFLSMYSYLIQDIGGNTIGSPYRRIAPAY